MAIQLHIKLWHLVMSRTEFNQSGSVFFLYICVFNCRYIFGSTCSVILLSLQQCTSTVYTDSHKLGVWGKILSHNSAVIYVKIIIEHWEELHCMLQAVILNYTLFCLFVCTVCIWSTWRDTQRPQLRTCCKLMPFLWILRCGFRLGTLGYPGDSHRGDRGPDRSWPTLLHRLCQLTVKWTLNSGDTYAAFLCWRPWAHVFEPEKIQTKRVHSHLKSGDLK